MADRHAKVASYENFWKRVSGDPYWADDMWNTTESTEWNPATGYSSPHAYLSATRGIPEWAAKFVTNIGSSGSAYNYADYVDDAGFVLPNAFASQRGTASSNFDLGWRYGDQDSDGSPIADSNEQQFMQELQKQLGGQVVLPYDSAFTTYKNSEIPTTGLDFQGYLNKQYVNPQVKEIPGLGKFVVAEGANSFDWGLGDRSSFLETLFGEMLPGALAMYGIGSGLSSLFPGDLLGSLGAGGAEFAGSPLISGSGGSTLLPGAASSASGLSDLVNSLGSGGAEFAGSSVIPGSAGSAVLPEAASALGLGGGADLTTLADLTTGGTTGLGGGADLLTLEDLTGSNILDSLDKFDVTSATGIESPQMYQDILSELDALGKASATGIQGLDPSKFTKATSFWDKLLEGVGLNKPTLTGLAGLATFLQNKDNSRYLANTLSDAAKQANPFGSQYPFYQDLLKQSYSDPNYWANNPVWKGMRDITSNDVQRVAAAKGQNLSTNVLHDMSNRLYNEGMKYAPIHQGLLLEAAGGKVSPGLGAGLLAQGAQQSVQAGNQANTGLWNALGSLFDIANQSSTQQAPSNPNLPR